MNCRRSVPDLSRKEACIVLRRHFSCSLTLMKSHLIRDTQGSRGKHGYCGPEREGCLFCVLVARDAGKEHLLSLIMSILLLLMQPTYQLAFEEQSYHIIELH